MRFDTGNPPADRRSRCRNVAAGMAAAALGACAATEPPKPDQQSGTDRPPMLARFVSAAPGTAGKVCYGAVVTEADGVPVTLRVIRSDGRPLCDQPVQRAKAVAELRAALKSLDDPAASHGPEEMIAAGELASRIRATIPMDATWLSTATAPAGRVYIVGAGINYGEHAKETGASEAILFPKPTLPTGPYAALAQVPRIDGKLGSVCLLDYEVEIAFVVLEDMDLRAVPGESFLWDRLAFFAVNDVSDREPIILDRTLGYTRAKARPGFLPSGPWLVAGWHVAPRTAEGGTEPLLLSLSTREGSAVPSPWIQRQSASSIDMTLGPRAILDSLQERDPTAAACRQGDEVCSMKDADGADRHMLHDHVLPAGSIVLTGTPGGTAIKDPGLSVELQYWMRANFDIAKARELAVDDQSKARSDLGYLEPGDEVDQTVGFLGRQRWRVAEDPASGGCIATP